MGDEPSAAGRRNHLDQVMRSRLTDRNAAHVLWTKMPSRLDEFAVSRWISSLRTDRPSSRPPQREQP